MEANTMVEREVFDWGVQLTVKPFPGTRTLEIRAEIMLPKATRGADVKISFNGVTFAEPLKLIEAQTWCEAMTALIQETRGVVAEMKNAAKVGKAGAAKAKKKS
jgi:hypothetical protein